MASLSSGQQFSYWEPEVFEISLALAGRPQRKGGASGSRLTPPPLSSRSDMLGRCSPVSHRRQPVLQRQGSWPTIASMRLFL